MLCGWVYPPLTGGPYPLKRLQRCNAFAGELDPRDVGSRSHSRYLGGPHGPRSIRIQHSRSPYQAQPPGRRPKPQRIRAGLPASPLDGRIMSAWAVLFPAVKLLELPMAVDATVELATR